MYSLSVVLWSSAASLLIFCLLDLPISGGEVLKSPFVSVVSLLLSAVLSVHSHTAVHAYTLRIVASSWNIGPIIFFTLYHFTSLKNFFLIIYCKANKFFQFLLIRNSLHFCFPF